MSTFGLRNVTFDDRDTDHLKYQGFWFLKGSWNASSVGDSGTLSSTNYINANVTFTFPAPAVAFYYYGIPRSNGGSYGICIDCDPNKPIFLPIDGVNATDDGKNPPIVLFSENFKEAGVHEIILRNQQDPRFNGNSQLTLDRFVLEVPVDSIAEPVYPSPTSPTISTTAFINTQTPTTSGSPAPSIPIAVIVGGVLGGFSVALFIILLLFWVRIRRLKIANPQSKVQHNGVYNRDSLLSFTVPSFLSVSAGYSVEPRKDVERGSREEQSQSRTSISTYTDTSSAAETSSTTLTTLLELLARRAGAGPGA